LLVSNSLSWKYVGITWVPVAELPSIWEVSSTNTCKKHLQHWWNHKYHWVQCVVSYSPLTLGWDYQYPSSLAGKRKHWKRFRLHLGRLSVFNWSPCVLQQPSCNSDTWCSSGYHILNRW
jgi:hypothetical protein